MVANTHMNVYEYVFMCCACLKCVEKFIIISLPSREAG